MVSNLYNAKQFFKLQEEGKIATKLNTSKKLRLDNKGYYLNKQTSNGETYYQRVSANDKVYSRSEGVTLYSPKRDTDKVKVRHKREKPKTYSRHAHMYDRTSLNGKVNYKK